MVLTVRMSAEDLMRLPDDARYELIEGELRPMPPIGRPHGKLLFRVGNPLTSFVERHGLGEVYGGEIGTVLGRDPDTVLAADIAFVRAGRRAVDDDGDGYIPGVPDLVVEIASPSDTRTALRDKVKRYLAAGVPLVWVVEPKTRTVSRFGADGVERVLTVADDLDGEDILPGFRLAVSLIYQ